MANDEFVNGGRYYDGYDYIYEVNANNNVLVASAPVTVTYQVVPADLAPVSVAAGSNNEVFYTPRPQNPTVPVVSVVTNVGLGVASGSWYDTVYVSSNMSVSGAVRSQN